MKKILLTLFSALLFVGCQDAPLETPTSQTVGKLSVSISGVSEQSNVQSRANVDLNSFYVEIYNSLDELVVRYETYGEVPKELELEEGSYTLKAATGQMASAAFDAPHFSGQTTVNVVAGLTTKAIITCKYTNIKVTLEFSDNLLFAMRDIEAQVTTIFYEEDGVTERSGTLTYTPEHNDDGWFTPPYDGNINVYITGTSNSTNKVQTISTVLTDAESGQWRQLNIDVETAGSGSVSIVIDDKLVVIEDGTIVVPDNGGSSDPDPDPDPDPDAKQPSVVGTSFGTDDNNSPFNIDEPVDFDLDIHTVLDILFTSYADNGIQEMGVTIDSPTLTPALLEALLGTSGEMDLANPDVNSPWYTMFTSADIALIDPNNPIKGKSEHTFAVGPLVSMLKAMQVTGTVTHKFIVRLKDDNGETTKTLTVNLTKH